MTPSLQLILGHIAPHHRAHASTAVRWLAALAGALLFSACGDDTASKRRAADVFVDTAAMDDQTGSSSSDLDVAEIDSAAGSGVATDALDGAMDAILGADSAKDVGPTKTFAIAAIADPHLTGTNVTTEKYKRLQAAVTWINENREARGIEVVVVLGDIGWSGGLKPARAALDKLEIPYVPIIGDNCMHAGDEKTWSDVFGPVYKTLESDFKGLSRGATPTTHGKTGKAVILQNVSFDLHGVHIVALDISPREKLGLIGELGDIHDYPGGSWPWFQKDIEKVKNYPKGSVLVAAHIPMHISAGALDTGHMAKVKALSDTVPGLIHASIAGHYHIDALVDIPSLPFPSYVVGPIFAGPLPVHIATATVSTDEVTWIHDTVPLPQYMQP